MHNLVPDNAETGLGDVVKRFTDALHIQFENCNCSDRQRWLNSKVTFVGKQSGIRRDGKR